MREQGSGLIVNTSIVYGRTVMLSQGAYSSSKRALEGLSDTLRAEVSDHGIDVAAVVVGITEDDDRPKRRIVGPWKYQMLLGRVLPDAVRDALFQGLKRLP